MLRVRSGGSGPEQPTDRDVELATIVEAAQAELDRAIQIGGLQNDPLRYTLRALSIHLAALQYVLLRFSARMDAADKRASTVQDSTAEKPRPASRIKDALLTAGLLVVVLLIGAGAGYWFRGVAPALIGVPAGPEKCDDRPDGSRLCWIPMWERLPPGH